MQAGDVITDRFELTELAAQGGMGEVWSARDRLSGERVALKVMREPASSAVQRFEREGRILAELRHPGIVRYIAHGTTPAGDPFLVMEWLEGEDLRQRLSREGLTVTESLELARRVAETLAVVHARGIVHRDIKPSNLFLCDRDLAKVKVLDFGVARLGATQHQTQTGVLVGTPGYMAPEQARGDAKVGPSVDVFALGCVLFTCLAGKPPFVGENIIAVLAKILIEDTPHIREIRPAVPVALEAFVARLMAKNATARPTDGAAVVAELDALGSLVSIDERAAPVAPQAASLTGSEQRFVSVVVCAPAGASTPTVATVADAVLGAQEARLEAAVAPFGARLEWLMNGTLVVTLASRGTAVDQAVQSARCALALKAQLPEAPIVLATGRGVIAARLPVGEVIDRAARMLKVAAGNPKGGERARAVQLDEVTAGLLDAGFDIGGDASGLFLRGEREAGDVTRTLLGRPTPCVGRDRELGVLGGLYEECVNEPRARAVLVTAPAGVGKSRLRYEFLRKLAARPDRPEIWIGRGDPMSAGSPFGLLGRAVRRAAGILDGEPLEARRLKLRARVARHVAVHDLERVAHFLGEVVGVGFSDDVSVQFRAARQDARLMSDQMLKAWEDFVAAECRARPVVLVLEDLHWGDLPTVKFVDSTLRSLADLPILVLALGRPEVNDLFPNLWSERGVQEVRVGELTKKSAEKLAREVLGGDVDDATVQRLVERAQGNAFYLEELLRAHVEGREEALPETVLAMVEARLERLEADARRVLRAASVFGQTFWEGGVAALLGGPQGEWLRVLGEREVISPRAETRFPEEREYVFRHALVREAAYAMLTDHDRGLGHKLAGEWLLGVGEQDAVSLAEHFERGREPARAVRWYKKAAEQALDGNDLEATIARVERGIACGAEGELRGAMRLLQAEAHRWRGEQAEAQAASAEAITLLEPGSIGWCEAAVELAGATSRLGDVAKMGEMSKEVLERLPPRLEARHVIALARLVQHLQHFGRLDLGDAMLETIAGSQAIVDADPAVAGRVYQARAFRAHAAGDPGEALRMREAAVEAFERAGDERNATGARLNLGHTYMVIGAFELAEIALRAALEAGERLGVLYVLNVAKNNLALTIANLGRIDEALRLESEALAAFVEQGDRRMKGGTFIRMAIIHSIAGHFREAAEAARQAENILPPSSTLHCYASGVLSRALRALGEKAEAARVAKDALARLEENGGWAEEGEALVRLANIEALDALGERAPAVAALVRARDRLLARAAKFADETMRSCFLERVEEHRATFALAKAWGVG